MKPATIIATAELFVGWVKEATKANDGPWVEAMQRVTGNKKGDPWCASFVTFVLDIAFKGQNPFVRTASCDVMLNVARRQGWIAAEPAPGDIFLVMKTDTDAVHTGFVSAVGKLAVKTIEGNTNADGSRDGWGVFARERRRGPKLVFIRIPENSR